MHQVHSVDGVPGVPGVPLRALGRRFFFCGTHHLTAVTVYTFLKNTSIYVALKNWSYSSNMQGIKIKIKYRVNSRQVKDHYIDLKLSDLQINN